MAITATKLRNLPNSRSDAALYRLSEPVPYGWNKDAGTTKYVVVSAVVAPYSGPETFIFPADKDGKILLWAEMDGSFRGALDHEAAIRNAGWTLASET